MKLLQVRHPVHDGQRPFAGFHGVPGWVHESAEEHVQGHQARGDVRVLGAMIMTSVAACYWKSFGLTVFFLSSSNPWRSRGTVCRTYREEERRRISCFKSCFGSMDDVF